MSEVKREQLEARIGTVTHDEAEQLALACIDAAFNNAPRTDGRRFRASIPVNPREDTDVRLMHYIKQQRAKEADQPAAIETNPHADCNPRDCMFATPEYLKAEPQGAPPECTCGAKYSARAHHHRCTFALWSFEREVKGAPQKPRT